MGLPEFKYDKYHLCSTCEQGKSKRETLKPKSVPSTDTRLEWLHMDLCGPIRVESINCKKYIMMIVNDYSRYTWVYFLRTKDEAPEMIINFINHIQVNLRATISKIRTDNGTEFKINKLNSHYAKLGITQQFSIARTPYQNVHARYNKTRYELIKNRKLNIQYFHVFGSLCYPTNDRDDLGKMKPKADIGIFIVYSESSRRFRIYKSRTRKIMETIHTPSKANLDDLFDPLYDEYYAGRNEEVSTNSAATTLLNNPDTPSTSSIIVDNNKAPQIVSTFEETTSPITHEIPDEFIQEDFANLDRNTFINPFGTHATDEAKSSSTNMDPLIMHEFHQLRLSTDKWTQAHILKQVISDRPNHL
ncbi:retrovirus-related pol polyprotein from transposon TNT 1-94 [Tanacetum coccineum]